MNHFTRQYFTSGLGARREVLSVPQSSRLEFSFSPVAVKKEESGHSQSPRSSAASACEGDADDVALDPDLGIFDDATGLCIRGPPARWDSPAV